METPQSSITMLEYKLTPDEMNKTCSADVDQTDRLINQYPTELEHNEISKKNSEELISQEETERKLLEKLQVELNAKEHQIATLLVETQKLQSTLIKVKENSFSQISDLENVVHGKEKLIAQLESKLQNQADYEQIKRELTLLKSIEYPSANEDSSKTFFEQNQPIKTEQNPIKHSPNDSESNTSHQQVQHSCRHCTSPCLHRNNAPFLPVPSLLSSSSASSSSNSSSSPSSPSQIYSKTPSRINGNANANANEELTRSINETSSSKFISPSSLSILTSKDNLQLCNSLSTPKYSSITSSCSTMVTPTASLLSSVTTTPTTLTPSNLFSGHQLSSVQCTKLHCPPTSSWSPPLSSSSGVSSIATTSTDNRTVLKTSKQMSPKPSTSPTILVPSSCPPVVSINPTNNTNLLEPLDTTYVATVVRKLLAQHNIGQRIFARYILSLSQGTVSELLSKPKSWSKLTEKGKESYRKMWCWANSEESILALKSISPRKGMNNRSKDNPYPAVSTKHTDPATHQRIVQILADAQKQQLAAANIGLINTDQKSSSSPCSSLPNDLSNPIQSYEPLESKTPSSSSASSTANSPLNESTSTEQNSFPLPPSSSSTTSSLSMLSAFVPSLLMRTANSLKADPTISTTGNLIDCSTSSPFSLLCHQPDNYRNWLMLQEIVRNNDLLKQFQPAFPPLRPISTDIGNESEHDIDDDHHMTDNENNDDDDDDEDNDENGEENDDDADDLDNDNPTSSDEIPLDLSMKLDSNQSDLDSTFVGITPKHHPPHTSTKHIKTALTPLREQDTSKYRHINTMELVQNIKDILSRYSISQRHFGEKILGLSQGSVSDILARPKQWESLTQKGREPFLRMRIFLDDPNAIKQLVQTVSTATTTPTTNATNTSSILLPTFCPTLSSPFPPTSLPSSLLTTPSLLSSVTANSFQSNNLLARDNSTDSHTNILINDSVQSLLPPPTSSNNSSSTMSNGANTNSNKSKSRSKNSKTTNDKSSNQSRTSSANPLMPPYELPKISLPATIDTEQLSSQVRELLFAYSIGQRVFGEAVLNLSQGTVSEILSKPRPWHSLSVKGREPYIRMYTWYNDANNVQKLLAWKRERDALRRSRPPVPVPTITDNNNNNNNGDQESGNTDCNERNNSTENTRSKRRSLFTDEQRRILKQIFDNEPYPSQSTLEQLVDELALPMNKIANWFHNSRMRAKSHLNPSLISTSSLNHQITPSDDDEDDNDDDEDDLDNNNNNNNNNVLDDGEDEDEADEDDYPTLPTIVPLTSSWLNGTNDSNSSSSPIAYSSTSTNIVPLIDDQKLPPVASTSSSSSKKRKSIPQKLVANSQSTKKFHLDSALLDNDSNDEMQPTTNDSNNFLNIPT